MKAKKLFDIFPLGFQVEIHGSDQVEVLGIEIDSRKINENFLYAALKGSIVDGHDFINVAIENGAKIIICECIDHKIEGITYLVTEKVREFLGQLLNNYYDNASESLKMIGVTGTNGKTTVSTLLYQLFSELGHKCGLISTVENKIGEEIIPSTHTTPDIVNLHRLIAKMRDEKCEFVFMEVSSHAIDQQRISGVHFEGAIFTNISHDHLDYHLTMSNYINAKKKFFDDLPTSSFAIVNSDDKNGLVMLQNTKALKRTYGLRSMVDFKAKILEDTVQGLHLKINNHEAFFRMIGTFNAYNLLCVYGAAVELGFESELILATLSGLKGADGRFDQIVDTKTGTCAIVDYAHTPDALENVLETIKNIKSKSTQIITVVGCGGDRDKTKRPIMSKVACKYSDKVVLTSDNPRTENPETILDDMEAGLDDTDKQKMIRIVDRAQAIKTAVMISNKGDIILVAGKGHENYQDINGEKFPFDDKKILKSLFN